MIHSRTTRFFILALVSFLIMGSCGDLLSSPPVTNAINSGPTVTPSTAGLTISWTTSAPSRYLVEYGTASGTYTQTTSISSSADTSHSVSLSGLSPATPYYYRITHFWTTGLATPSSEFNATTSAETTPSMAQKLRGIWIVGGAANLDGSGIYSQLDLYDPVTDTWYANAAAGASGTYTPTVHNSVASVKGKLYVLGGAVSGPAVTASVFEYDIAANAWRTMANIGGGAGTPLMGSAVYVHANNIYLIGGTGTTVTGGVSTAHLRFDPESGATGQWYTLLGFTTARASMGAGYFDGSVCYFGGRIAAGGGSTTNDIYVVATNTYTTGATEPVIASRAGTACATYSSVNGIYIFIVGGANTYTAAAAYFGLTAITYVAQASSLQIYTPPASTGPTAGRYHPAFSGGTATGIVFASAAVSQYNGSGTYNPTLYVFGGIRDMNVVTNQVYAMDADEPLGSYNPTGLLWVAKSSMPVPRYGFGATTVNQ